MASKNKTESPLAISSLAIAAGLIADRLIKEPPNAFHPVAWFGTAMTKLEEKLWSDRKTNGALYCLVGAGGGYMAGWCLQKITRQGLWQQVATQSVAVFFAVAGGSLRDIAAQVEKHLEAEDLEAARQTVSMLVGRNTSEFGESEIAAAAIESVAENTVDALVAPVFWALVAQSPGVLAYRAINTMDAMVGHRSKRYANFGTAAARCDDVANFLPARFCGLLFAAQNPLKATTVWEAVTRQARLHPSPNSGVSEAAMAVLCDIELGGRWQSGDRVENRPKLGFGARPDRADIAKANRVSQLSEQTLLAMSLAIAAVAVATKHRCFIPKRMI